MEQNISINLVIDLYNACMCLFILVSVNTNNKNKNSTDLFFSLTCLTTMIHAISDCVSRVCEGKLDILNFYITRISNFFVWFSSAFITTFFLYLVLHIFRPNKTNKVYKTINIICCSIYLFFLFINLFIPFYYDFDANNIYRRVGYGYYISLSIQTFQFILSLIIIFGKGIHVRKIKRLVVSSFVFLPFIGLLLQSQFIDYTFSIFFLTISLFIIFIVFNKQIEDQITTKIKSIYLNKIKIQSIQENTITSLADLVENRDSDTGNHVKRTSLYVELLATETKNKGFYTEILTDNYIQLVTKAAPLHDIGKIIVPDDILKKPGKLTTEEFEIMKKHTIQGSSIINQVLDGTVNKEYIKIANEIATSHHEKYDGKGYPNNLVAQEIPLSARLMAVADVFDALVSPRCYKSPFSLEKAFSILQEDSGSHFDPILIPIFISLKSEIERIIHTYQDTIGGIYNE